MREKIKIYILAGGKSSRMGTDKSQILVDGKSFLQRITEAAEQIDNNITIVGGLERHKFGYPQILDILPNLGPIGGLYTALMNSDRNLNLVLSCDVPLISTKLLQNLLDAWKNNCDILHYNDGKKTMPLVGLYHKNCLETCKKKIEMGDLKMMNLLAQLNCKFLKVNENESWRLSNINTPEELENLKHKF